MMVTTLAEASYRIMRTHRWRWLIFWAGWTVTCLAGCKSFFAPRGIPNDPLLLSRPPIESKGQVTPPPVQVHSEPEPPGEIAPRPAATVSHP
jgi:hypothetical protein